MTKADYLTTVKNSGANLEQVTREASMPVNSTTTAWALHQYLDIPRTDLGLRCPPANAAATLKIAIFTLRLLLFYIVNNGGKSRTVRAQPRPQRSLSRKKGKPL